MEAISVDKLCRDYYLKNELIHAINNISYTFEYGKFYAIMGHSGSGKSTLIQCIGLLDKVDSGKIYIDGENVSSLKEHSKNEIRNKKIGFIFQDYYLNNTMKAYENVMLPMLINDKYNKTDMKKRAKELLKLVGLEDRVNHYPKELSGGEQQRVAIARALANSPSIILADEPTGNLDEFTEKYVLEKLRKLADEGNCIIVVSYNPVIVESADYVLKMKSGRFIYEG